MGARGPVAASNVVDIARGNPSKRHRDEISRPKTEAPACPAWLPGAARTQWNHICRSLVADGLINPSQGAALAMALLHWAVARKAMLELLSAPSMQVIDTKNADRPMKHPASQIARDHSTQFLAYAKQIGLTNEALARLMHALVPALPEDDDDDDSGGGIFDT